MERIILQQHYRNHYPRGFFKLSGIELLKIILRDKKNKSRQILLLSTLARKYKELEEERKKDGKSLLS